MSFSIYDVYMSQARDNCLGARDLEKASMKGAAL